MLPVANSDSFAMPKNHEFLRIFLSFETKHRFFADQIECELKNQDPEIVFLRCDHISNPQENWKSFVLNLLKKSNLTICLLSQTTPESAPVIWELNKSNELGKEVIGIKLFSEKTPIPSYFEGDDAIVLPWDVAQIASEIYRRG